MTRRPACTARPGGARLRALAALSALLCAALAPGLANASSAYAAGANFVATGHDMDFHCAEGTTSECEYFKILVDKVRNGSTLPILALDQGSEVANALKNAGFTGAGEVVAVNPAEPIAFGSTPFVNGKGEPLYSIIITASDSSCGGCDDDETGESAINARAADFTTYFNAGGGIFALAGADQFETYYNFVPLKVGATAVSPPFEVTPEGEALGATNTMANCCPTHNSFTFPPPEPLLTLEKDSAGKAETIAAFDVKITEKGFGAITETATALSGEGKSGASITVVQGSAVTDQATITGSNVSKAIGAVAYRVYSDAECKTLVAEAGSVSVSEGKAPASLAEALGAGTYYWQASYGGDTTNAPSSSTCGSEVETVLPKVEPKKAVLGFGTAHTSSAHACLAHAGYVASVRGTLISSVTFILDGHRVATVRKPNSHGAFAARLSVSSGRKHHLTLKVAFTSASSNRSATITRTLARCAARVVVKPRFTG